MYFVCVNNVLNKMIIFIRNKNVIGVIKIELMMFNILWI